MSMKEKMHTGELYLPNDEEILTEQIKKLDLLYEYNSTRPTQTVRRKALLKQMFAEDRRRVLYRASFSREFRGSACAFR